MSIRNPLILSSDNISTQLDVLSEIIKKPQKKPVLFVIKADWCPHCQTFAKNIWNSFKKTNTATTHFQMIEMDDKALSWLRQNNQKQLHESLLVDPPSVYFPQVYMLIDKRKHAFVQMNPEPKKTPLNVFTDWVDSFVPHRKITLHRPKNPTGGKEAKRPVKVISKTNIVRRKVSSQAKKSLKDEIDDAFKKLFLH